SIAYLFTIYTFKKIKVYKKRLLSLFHNISKESALLLEFCIQNYCCPIKNESSTLPLSIGITDIFSSRACSPISNCNRYKCGYFE
ncbi:hypothetical protein, partial [Prevotella disiens]|uniref:hypothetical protein n=1 Tax=Prevotella disiens TaxID=28130 RepID=UPI001C7035BC